MAEKSDDGKRKGAEKPAKKAGAKKASAKKTAEKKTAAKKEKAAAKPPREEFEKILDDTKTAAREEPGEAAAGQKEGELSEEELRRMVEERLEKVTVKEVVLAMMNELASIGYMKMGLPESVNLKYRDLAQAGLAIDILEGMIKAAENKVDEELLRPFRGTLANLQLNFVQAKRL